MNVLPKNLLSLMLAFAPLFSKRVWQSVLVLVVGAILAPGKRTVSAILHVMGLEQNPQFQTYHRVLNRAVWSSRKASAILLSQWVAVFASSGTLVFGIDDTIERRWGKRVAVRGIYCIGGALSCPVPYGGKPSSRAVRSLARSPMDKVELRDAPKRITTFPDRLLSFRSVISQNWYRRNCLPMRNITDVVN